MITRYLYLFNRILISPVIRARPSDRLCLRFLQWLHSAHPQSQHIPAAFSDGSFASWPDPRFPTIYVMPPSAQRRLLYLSLFFHEFGHLLYACHKPEMDDLVRSLQQTISEYLEPSVQRDDAHAKREQKQPISTARFAPPQKTPSGLICSRISGGRRRNESSTLA